MDTSITLQTPLGNVSENDDRKDVAKFLKMFISQRILCLKMSFRKSFDGEADSTIYNQTSTVTKIALNSKMKDEANVNKNLNILT